MPIPIIEAKKDIQCTIVVSLSKDLKLNVSMSIPEGAEKTPAGLLTKALMLQAQKIVSEFAGREIPIHPGN